MNTANANGQANGDFDNIDAILRRPAKILGSSSDFKLISLCRYALRRHYGVDLHIDPNLLLNIATIADLAALDLYNEKVRNVGPKVIEKLRTKLNRFGLEIHDPRAISAILSHPTILHKNL